jgi:hypothetical protein
MAMTRAVPRRAAATAAKAPHPVRRAGTRLWIMLHAQALLNGTPAGIHHAAFVEDDHPRLSRRG